MKFPLFQFALALGVSSLIPLSATGAAAISISDSALKNAASCQASKERFDAAYGDIRQEADRREEGCGKARNVKSDLQCAKLADINQPQASCCIFMHNLVANHIASIGGELQKACDELTLGDQEAAKCQAEANSQKCPSKARAPHLKKAAAHFKAMKKLIKESRIVQDKVRGYTVHALNGMIDHLQNDAGSDPASLCHPDSDDFFQGGAQSLNDAFGLGLACSGNEAADKKSLKQKLDAMEKYRDSLVDNGSGKENDPRQKGFGPYVEEEANSVWIASRLEEESKKLEPTASELAASTDFQATQAENAARDLSSMEPPPASDVTGGKPSDHQDMAGGGGGKEGSPPPTSGLSTTGASAAGDYRPLGGGTAAAPASRADGGWRQQFLPSAMTLVPSAFSGNLSYPPPERAPASAEGTSPTPAAPATTAAYLEEAATLKNDGATEGGKWQKTGLEANGQPNHSSITLAKADSAKPEGGAEAAAPEAGYAASGGGAARLTRSAAKPDQGETARKAGPAAATLASFDRAPASESGNGKTGAEPSPEEEAWTEIRRGPALADQASSGKSAVEELSRNPSLREALRKKLEEGGKGGTEMEQEKREELERMLAQAEKLAGGGGSSAAMDSPGSTDFSMDPAETERAIGRLLAQLDGVREESLFSRVRGAYRRFQRKDAQGRMTL